MIFGRAVKSVQTDIFDFENVDFNRFSFLSTMRRRLCRFRRTAPLYYGSGNCGEQCRERGIRHLRNCAEIQNSRIF